MYPRPVGVRGKAPEPTVALVGVIEDKIGLGLLTVTMLPELPQAANPRRRAKIRNSWIRRSIAKPLYEAPGREPAAESQSELGARVPAARIGDNAATEP